MNDIPFFPNTEDNLQCVVSVYRSLLAYFLHKQLSQAEVAELVGYQQGKAMWTLGSLTKLAQAGLDIQTIEPFDYRVYAKRGRDYLEGVFPPEKLKWQLEHTNILDMPPLIPEFLRTVRWEKRAATLQDIDNFLTKDYLVFVTLNARVLNGKRGFVSHAVLVIGRDKGDYIVHDPGLPPLPNRRVPRSLLWDAMGGSGHTEEVTGFKLKTGVGERLDQYVVLKKPRLSRAFAGKLIADGRVTVNGQPAKGGYKVKTTDTVEITYDERILDTVPDIDLPVLYEDADCIVLNKPAGILTHVQGEFNPEATVASFLRTRSESLVGDRAGVVHRLDRATSGVIIGAKNQHALQYLQKQFADRKANKTYLAIVEGHLKQAQAVIDMPIQRNPKAPATFRVGPNGKQAATRYKVLEEHGDYSLLELKPETGRTHQLRVHLQKIGHPIVGDPLYGNGQHGGRLFLHAYQLELTLPDGDHRTFTAPIPPEFKEKMRG